MQNVILIILMVLTGQFVFSQQSTVTITESASSCGTQTTDCLVAKTICFDINLTVDQNTTVSAYNIWVGYDNTIYSRVNGGSDNSCIINDAGDTDVEATLGKYRVGGDGDHPPEAVMTADVPKRIHTICLKVLDGQESKVLNSTVSVGGDVAGGALKSTMTYQDGNFDDNIPETTLTVASDFENCPQANPSPVSYTSFEAKRRNSASELTWTTASENNNSHFDIERSVDGRSWTAIGKVEGNGTSKSATDYRFIDDAPMADNYYRLKQVDYDGKHEYSDARYVRFENIKNVAVYPNPFLSDLTIGTGGYTGSIALEVRDVNGKTLYRETMDTRTVDLSQLEAGVYMIHVQDSNGGLLLNQRIIKVD